MSWLRDLFFGGSCRVCADLSRQLADARTDAARKAARIEALETVERHVRHARQRQTVRPS